MTGPSERLPIPLPRNSIPDERRIHAGRAISSPAIEPICTKRTGTPLQPAAVANRRARALDPHRSSSFISNPAVKCSATASLSASSSMPNRTTASAPRASSTAGLRPVAMTRPAPRCRAMRIASWQDAPVAPLPILSRQHGSSPNRKGLPRTTFRRWRLSQRYDRRYRQATAASCRSGPSLAPPSRLEALGAERKVFARRCPSGLRRPRLQQTDMNRSRCSEPRTPTHGPARLGPPR